MQTNDIINGSFELVGGVASWINVYKLYQDKAVRGVYWPAMFFFAAWGFWNMYYYPTLDQTFSFIGGAFMSLANAAWVILAWKYTRQTFSVEVRHVL
jgi:hypothetical protein